MTRKMFYGPVMSRRLGFSLGVNLLPIDRKVCNLDCAYCECGLNQAATGNAPLPSMSLLRAAFSRELEQKKSQGVHLDHITFSGSGEPTLHPQFAAIIDLARELRDKYYPGCQIAVLTNSTNLHRSDIREALRRVDKAICKLDAGSEAMFQAIDRPTPGITLDRIVGNLTAMQGQVYVQTMLLRGYAGATMIDNTTAAEVALWLQHLARIRPRGVMLYTLDRLPPYPSLSKVETAAVEAIASQVRALGIAASCYA